MSDADKKWASMAHILSREGPLAGPGFVPDLEKVCLLFVLFVCHTFIIRTLFNFLDQKISLRGLQSFGYWCRRFRMRIT